jgi:7-cyano-7-deazaguanine reductase
MGIEQHLGQTSEYKSTYDASLLVTELRQTNRDGQNITSEMVGTDLWNVYEISFLTNHGQPINGVGKISYSSSNETIVESKSLKLYFFSWNMTKVGETAEEASKEFSDQVTADLSSLLKTPVTFSFYRTHLIPMSVEPFEHYSHIDLDLDDIEFTDVNENPALLESIDCESELMARSSLLRSNCKITNQPDYGDVFIYYRGPRTLDLNSLAKYLVSFRAENHFHEEVCEMIYDRLVKALQPVELVVACRYTRRGGIDINPVRSNREDLIPYVYSNPDYMLTKLPRQ